MISHYGIHCHVSAKADSSVLHRLVLRHELILKNERFKVKRTMFAKFFGVKAPFSKFNVIHSL